METCVPDWVPLVAAVVLFLAIPMYLSTTVSDRIEKRAISQEEKRERLIAENQSKIYELEQELKFVYRETSED